MQLIIALFSGTFWPRKIMVKSVVHVDKGAFWIEINFLNGKNNNYNNYINNSYVTSIPQ